MVRRMDLIAVVDETHWGEYVEYTDYVTLESENARLREALRECVEALAGLRGIVLEVETACDIWHGRGLVGSRPGMFRISYAVASPKSSVAIVKAGVVEKSVREELGDDPITPGE